MITCMDVVHIYTIDKGVYCACIQNTMYGNGIACQPHTFECVSLDIFSDIEYVDFGIMHAIITLKDSKIIFLGCSVHSAVDIDLLCLASLYENIKSIQVMDKTIILSSNLGIFLAGKNVLMAQSTEKYIKQYQKLDSSIEHVDRYNFSLILYYKDYCVLKNYCVFTGVTLPEYPNKFPKFKNIITVYADRSQGSIMMARMLDNEFVLIDTFADCMKTISLFELFDDEPIIDKLYIKSVTSGSYI